MSLQVAAAVVGRPRWPTICEVTVRLRNAGDEPLVVCGRLAVGYRETDGRELFLEVHPPGSDEVVSSMTRLYDRDPPAPEDYVALAPGEELETTFDLMRWHALPGPGAYELEAFYDGDEPGAPAVDGAVGGLHGSRRVAFDLPEETWDG